MKNDKDYDNLLKERLESEGALYKTLLEYATEIARGKGYSVSGWDALYVLFADKFAWTPAQVRSMTLDEVSMMLGAFFSSEAPRIKSGT